jgi:acrylyl-CoA reductase (NADPH)
MRHRAGGDNSAVSDRLPGSFRAFVMEREGEGVTRGVRSFRAADLPPGEVTIRVEWSGVNYKDALATIAAGKVARISPLIPGIDLAGVVVESSDPAFVAGQAVLANGYELGVSRHGGYGEFARLPAEWVVALPADLTARDAMAIGTAGFTAAMSVAALEERGLTPDDGPVLVTGASGGVGRMAIGILARRGYEVWAVTGKADETERLRALGAAGVLDRSVYEAGAGRALEPERWAGAIDSVGAASLPYVLRTLRYGRAVAASGNASGPALATTVFPFILRAVSLIGIDSGQVPILTRRLFWQRLARDLRPAGLEDAVTEVTLDTLEPALDAILRGEARGRWVVRVAGG